MMRKYFGILLLLSLCIGVVNAHSGEAHEKPSLQVFFVSVLLSKQGESNVVRLVHSVQSALTNTDAELSFMRLIARDFPGYTIMTTLSSPESAITPPPCVQRSLGVNI